MPNTFLLTRLFTLLTLFLCTTAHARLEIEISGGTEAALPIAVAPFQWQVKGSAEEELHSIISADLRRGGLFRPLAEGDLPERPKGALAVKFDKWRQAGMESLVIGAVSANTEGYQVEFQLLDVVSGKQLIGYSIPVRKDGLRRVAHQIADLVQERLTGIKGAYNTHIVYVTVVGSNPKKRRYRLAIADADGYNEQIILESREPLLSPTWSPDGERLAYVSFESGRSNIYIQSVRAGSRRLVASYPGINSAPAWSPDGRLLAMSLSQDGNSEIYVKDLSSGSLMRITNNYAIDTEPTFSPDGSRLYFTSDRGGKPQVYQVEMNGIRAVSRPTRVTYEGSYNARPALSPDGKQMSMVQGEGNTYRIAVMNLDSGRVRVLTRSRLDESPSFAPNGQMVIYASEVGGRGVLEVVSVDGLSHQRLRVDQGDVREPAWSPYIGK